MRTDRLSVACAENIGRSVGPRGNRNFILIGYTDPIREQEDVS